MSTLPFHIFHTKLIDSGDMSVSIKSSSQNLNETSNYAVSFVWSGSSPVGAIYLEVANEDNDDDYTRIDTSLLAVTGNSGSHVINVERPGYSFVRLRYIRTSGSGTGTCTINGKRG